MELLNYISDEKRATEVAENCLTIVEPDIEYYIRASLNNIIKDNGLSTSKLKDRFRICKFLKIIKQESYFFRDNPISLMLSEKNINKVSVIERCIDIIIEEYMKTGITLADDSDCSLI